VLCNVTVFYTVLQVLCYVLWHGVGSHLVTVPVSVIWMLEKCYAAYLSIGVGQGYGVLN
jgi:hypothetical protein